MDQHHVKPVSTLKFDFTAGPKSKQVVIRAVSLQQSALNALPRFAGQMINEPGTNQMHRVGRIVLDSGAQQRRNVVHEGGIVLLAVEVLFELGTGEPVRLIDPHETPLAIAQR